MTGVQTCALPICLLDQVADLVEDFVRDNLDSNLEMDDLIEQHATVMHYISAHLEEVI